MKLMLREWRGRLSAPCAALTPLCFISLVRKSLGFIGESTSSRVSQFIDKINIHTYVPLRTTRTTRIKNANALDHATCTTAKSKCHGSDLKRQIYYNTDMQTV